ncbi:hypothetical protein BKA63DRAFT_67388 [Paraphoma chrysanthemicola]|nr:hypothetical protein BKA63DRAFT_67388 [Paraphoma chrysanthemicola]
MAGIEAAGLAVGVVPIVLECLKAYRGTKHRLDTFRNYTHVVFDIQLRLRFATAEFRQSCQLLLELVVGRAQERSDMVADPQHSAWQDPSLDRHFRKLLKRDYALIEDILIKIHVNLSQTQTKLKECTDRPAMEDSSQSSIGERFQAAFHISRKESRYGEWLDELDIWNKRLGRLCKQTRRDVDRCEPAIGRAVRRVVPQYYRDVSLASQRLHEALQESWSCTNISHTGHQAKLGLGATFDVGGTQLEMTIACRQRASSPSTCHSIPNQDPLIWLHVKSLTTKDTSTDPVRPSPATAGITSTLEAVIHEEDPVPLGNDQCQSNSRLRLVRRKLKRVRIDVAPSEQEDLETTRDHARTKEAKPNDSSSGTNSQSFVTLDLKATDSVCDHMIQNYATPSTRADSCLGYLESPSPINSFRLIFYDASRHATASAGRLKPESTEIPVSTLLPNLHAIHQLTLAYKLAVATLQYHATPWLKPDWRLQDVSYFDDTAKTAVGQQLQGLHLSTQFPAIVSTASVSSSLGPQELKRLHGVRNLPLAKLGVALLEICHQQSIGSLITSSTPHDVISARELLDTESTKLPPLGNRYLSMAQKCIDCDFACGNDLRDASLQCAVYSEVVCVLEEMIIGMRKTLGIMI